MDKILDEPSIQSFHFSVCNSDSKSPSGHSIQLTVTFVCISEEIVTLANITTFCHDGHYFWQWILYTICIENVIVFLQPFKSILPCKLPKEVNIIIKSEFICWNKKAWYLWFESQDDENLLWCTVQYAWFARLTTWWRDWWGATTNIIHCDMCHVVGSPRNNNLLKCCYIFNSFPNTVSSFIALYYYLLYYCSNAGCRRWKRVSLDTWFVHRLRQADTPDVER